MAPQITGMVCASVIMPALTNPIIVIEVAAEDWIIAVTPVPSSSPFHRLSVKRSIVRSSFAPANFSIDEAIRFIPYKNIPIPANRGSTFEIVSIFHLSFSITYS